MCNPFACCGGLLFDCRSTAQLSLSKMALDRDFKREREKKSIVGVEIYDGNRDTYTVGLVSIAWKEEEEGIIIKRGQADRANHTHTHTVPFPL